MALVPSCVVIKEVQAGDLLQSFLTTFGKPHVSIDFSTNVSTN